MSVNYGNGIETGKKVFDENEQQTLKQAKEKNAYLSKVEEELTALNKGFDELITKTRELQFNLEDVYQKSKIDSTLTTSLMKSIQETRDKCINELKEVLLES